MMEFRMYQAAMNSAPGGERERSSSRNQGEHDGCGLTTPPRRAPMSEDAASRATTPPV